MHTAVNRLKGSGAEDSIDVVKWAIRTIHALMIEYPLSKDEYNSASHVFAYARQSTKVTKNQKLFPRYALLSPLFLIYQVPVVTDGIWSAIFARAFQTSVGYVVHNQALRLAASC